MINSKHKIIIVRHGETNHNAHGSHIQDGFVPLNDKGMDQAIKLGDVLRQFPIEQIISSNLTRAIQTAELINQSLGIHNFSKSDLFNERDQGVIKNLTHEEVRNKFPQYWNFERNIVNYKIRPENGESWADLEKRVDQAIEFMNQLDKNTIIVSHGGFIRCLLSKIHGINDEIEIGSIYIPNCSYFELN